VGRFLVADFQHLHPIHGQSFKRCPPGSSQANNPYTFPTEVIYPPLASWMEDRHHLARIRVRRDQTCRLAQRTRNTSQCKIVIRGFAADGDGDDMIDMEGGRLAGLG
jgi:hypothetical protein